MRKYKGIGIVVIVSVCVGSWLNAAQQGDQNSGQLQKQNSPTIAYKPSLLVQLSVASLDRSIHFYKDVLGLELVLRDNSLRWAKFSLGIDNVKIGIGEGTEPLGSGSVSMNIGVVDIEAARKTLERRGVVFKSDTIVIPEVVKLADFADPDGNKIRLAQSLAKND